MAQKMFRRSTRPSSVTFHNSLTGMYFLLAGLTVVLLPHIQHLPLWTSLTCFGLLLWRWLYDIKRLPLPNKYIIFLLFGLILLGVLSSYHTIVGREAGTALLITLLCLKLFEIKSLRDISLIIQLAFFAIVVTFLFSQSIFVAMTMLVAVILLITGLISFQHAKSANNHNAQSEKEHLILASKMVLYAIPLTIIIFILFPRTGTPLWGLPQDAFQAKTGLSDEMSPGNISNLSDSPAVAFRVQFESTIPEPAKTYWRGPVLWSFDGTTWSAPESQRRALRNIVLTNTSNPIDYTITLEPHNNFWLFALDQPGTIPHFALLSTEMQLVARKPINHLMRYDLTSYLDYSVPWILVLHPDRYLHVPSESAPRARQFVKELIEQYPDKTDVVNAVLQRFRSEQYYYTRQPPFLFDDPVDEFLFETKRGYCEHYASTFTVLMRLAGIPARVVTGYQGGEMNPLSNYMIVRQSDAHAWSEIYLENQGWLRVDPTAVIPAENVENVSDIVRFRSELVDSIQLSEQNWYSASAKQLQFAWDMVNNRWNQWVIGYTTQKQKSLFNALGIPEITWQGLSYLLFTTLTIFTTIIAANIFLAHRHKRDIIEKIYLRFLRKLRPLQIEKAPYEGALKFSQRVARQYPEQTTDLLRIASLYNFLRYSGSKPDVVEALRQAIKKIHFPKR